MAEFLTSHSGRRKSVFISYAYDDKAVAEALAGRLKSSGVDAWSFTDLLPGENWHDAVNAKLRSSDYFIALISRSSSRSKYFLEEIVQCEVMRELSDRSITVIPILIEDAEMPPSLRRMSPLDFRLNLEVGIAKLASVLSPAVDIDFSTLSPMQFEELIADLLRGFGHAIEREVTYGNRRFDFGVSLVRADPFGMNFAESWLIDVKHHRSGRLSTAVIADFARLAYNTSDRNIRILLVTSGQVTSAARELLQRVPLRLVEGVDLKRILLAKPEFVRVHFHRQDRE